MSDDASDVRLAEDWFQVQGLPWFVDAVDDRVRELLHGRRLWFLLVGVLLLAGAAGWLTYRASEDPPSSVMVAVSVALVLGLAYAGGPLRVGVMARWAARKVLSELDLLLPLVSRALPLLMLIMTFFFLSTEAWQITAALSRPSLYAVLLLFGAVGVAFLLTRLPEEVRRAQRAVRGDGLATACAGTPLEARAQAVAESSAAGTGADGDPTAGTLTSTQRANLILVLLVTQAVQVILLTLAVFAFFVVFGLLVIDPEVVATWLELDHPPSPIVWDVWFLRVVLPVSNELYQVSLFVAGFAGLYFTVYAVGDSTYRELFFAELSQGLERAIAVRAVYCHLIQHDHTQPDDTAGSVDISVDSPHDHDPLDHHPGEQGHA